MAEQAAAATASEVNATIPALSAAMLRAVADRVYELMRDDIVVQRERRGLSGARWR
jgi:hypothetical protein